MTFKEYFLNILIGFDQLINCFMKGKPDETISARAYRLKDRYWYAKLNHAFINALFYIFEKEHCKKAFESEILRSQYPKYYQEYLNILKEQDIEKYNLLTNNKDN